MKLLLFCLGFFLGNILAFALIYFLKKRHEIIERDYPEITEINHNLYLKDNETLKNNN